jgi:hypothetical protein
VELPFTSERRSEMAHAANGSLACSASPAGAE